MSKMTPIWRCWWWKLGLAGLFAISGAIAASGDCAIAQIRPDTFGVGNAGNVTVLASDSVEVIGSSSADAQTISRLSSLVDLGAKGNAGNLTDRNS